ncbi:unnamed protein product [Bursaphelenchus okinawaensis]|uniref:Mitochondrial inner membrane protein Mpv17 n=1 Tax=Bursaphelenchus okinawaensis TaxID=465554 RepID=A0A811LJT5_9BILA|nr:unnamed protein product [Bursaphelenchus okinawaensis]CAG9124413.1 unnamed protein product [Bursaphelenchus okinawaensis]
MLQAYLRLLSRRPLITQMVSAGIIGCAGDGIAQFAVEKRSLKQYDVQRGIRFFIMPSCYVAPILSRWFRVLEKIGGKGAMFKRLAVDQLCWSPCFGSSIIFVLNFMETFDFKKSFEHTKSICFEVYLKSLQFWPFFQIINLNLIPINLRVIFVQFAALIWNSYLSFKTQTPVGEDFFLE